MASAGDRMYFHFPPDPVNFKTLNFFLPVDHLSLPCYMPIEVKAAYNSYAGDMSIFGSKWTFNYNIFIQRVGTHLEVREGDGFSNPYYKEKNLEEANKALAEQLVVARKKADLQNASGLQPASVYDDYKKRVLTDVTFREEQEEKLLARSRNLSPGMYYSLARGPSTLELKADGSFVRSFQNGASEAFNRDGRIITSTDRNGNSITFAYQGNLLTRANDMCGRYMSFSYKTDKALNGLVSSITDSIGREMKYEYFPEKRLKSVLDPSKRLIEYTYDKDGNMTSISTKLPSPNDKNPEVIQLTYNSKGEVETQKGPGKAESRFKRTFVANNPNHSITEIARYANGKLESREVQESKLKEFEQISRFDASGKETKKEIRKISPVTGYPISILDGKGNGELYDYDAQTGNLLKRQTIPAQETLEFAYDDRCNLVTKMITKRAGQPDLLGIFAFDTKCNLLDAKEIIGAKETKSINIRYNAQGKIAFLTNKLMNKEVAFTYWKYGKPDSITLKDVGSLIVTYSALGDIEKVDTYPHGAGKKRFEKTPKNTYQSIILSEVRGALDEMLNYLKPAGVNIGL